MGPKDLSLREQRAYRLGQLDLVISLHEKTQQKEGTDELSLLMHAAQDEREYLLALLWEDNDWDEIDARCERILEWTPSQEPWDD